MKLCTIASVVCRIIPDFDDDNAELIIASYEDTQSLIALGWDESICYYATRTEMKLSDRQFFELIFS